MHKRTIQRRKAAQYRNKYFAKRNNFEIGELYDLNTTIVDFCVPRLKKFRELTCSYPPDITFEEWRDVVLATIIKGFEIYLKKGWYDYTDEDKDTLEKAFDYFHKYFPDLWW